MLEGAGIQKLTQYQFDTLSFLNFNLPSAAQVLINDFSANGQMLTQSDFSRLPSLTEAPSLIYRIPAATELWFNHQYTHGLK